MHRLTVLFLILFTAFSVFSAFFAFAEEEKVTISGVIEWDTFQMKVSVSLDLASAGVKIPSGRTQAEILLSEGYLRLVRAGFMELQVDSSSTIGDIVERRELYLEDIDSFTQGAAGVAPSLSRDMRSMASSYTIDMVNLSISLLRHTYPSNMTRTLNPVSAAQYTGIVVIAVDELPIYGMRGMTSPVPCLYPKIWDSDMNLIYERSMLVSRVPQIRYFNGNTIMQNNPSGLSEEVRQIVGDRPLRIFARGVFGIKPTDLIIDREDALTIISSEENRRLLSQGKVVFILDDSALKQEFSGN
jgi:hypothetical protein